MYVTGEDGQEREARIVDLSASLLTVSTGGARVDLTERGMRRIKGKKPIYGPRQSAGAPVAQPVLLSRATGLGLGLRFDLR